MNYIRQKNIKITVLDNNNEVILRPENVISIDRIQCCMSLNYRLTENDADVLRKIHLSSKINIQFVDDDGNVLYEQLFEDMQTANFVYNGNTLSGDNIIFSSTFSPKVKDEWDLSYNN